MVELKPLVDKVPNVVLVRPGKQVLEGTHGEDVVVGLAAAVAAVGLAAAEPTTTAVGAEAPVMLIPT
jgi:hypothetical protein